MSESFFDFHKRVSQPPPAEKVDDRIQRAISITQLTLQIDQALKSQLPSTLLVRGELSNLNIHRASGHIYFTLKDNAACIDGVMFKSDAARLKFTPKDGDELLATGGVRVYQQRGRYQFYATSFIPIGQGGLELAFRQLHEKLEKEGLFNAERKRPLPRYAQHIVLVTSRQAAALQDMLKVLSRFPWIKLTLEHVPVQGDGSAEQIVAKLKEVSGRAKRDHIDLIILGRGGGSLEDLWEFNEEIVARAIVASSIPVVTGIGHEVDVSIADLAADYHAHTPTEAAQVVTAPWREAQTFLANADQRLRRSVKQLLQSASDRLRAVERHEVFRRPTDRIERLREVLDDREKSLRQALRNQFQDAHERILRADSRLRAHHPASRYKLASAQVKSLEQRLHQGVTMRANHFRSQLDGLARELEALNPTKVLQRGYSMTTKKNGELIRSAKDVKQGDKLLTRLADGTVESVARDPNQPELF